MQIRLIATDLDGTLVPAGGSTPERVLLTLEEAMRRGILVVPATGRTLTSIPPEISGLVRNPIYHIFERCCDHRPEGAPAHS